MEVTQYSMICWEESQFTQVVTNWLSFGSVCGIVTSLQVLEHVSTAGEEYKISPSFITFKNEFMIMISK